MPQTFSPKSNSAAKLFILSIIVLGLVFIVTAFAFVHSDYSSGKGIAIVQPIPFSHAHHVRGLGLDCRYCHNFVETSSNAGYPDTYTCMGCHSQIWKTSPLLKPVRESLEARTPIRWVKVNELPDHVFFDHSIHVNKGIGCVSCHGRVSEMPVIMKIRSFTMRDCLDCHRSPEKYLRPVSEIYNENWMPPDESALGEKLLREYKIDKDHLTDCTVCHR